MASVLSEHQGCPEVVGRFAPSPSGRFHVGNIFASLVAALVADKMVLRIEDLDPDRSKQRFIDGVKRDLAWFGFEWVGEPVHQSALDRQEAYRCALSELEQADLVYPCFCSRADLHSVRAPHIGEEYIYQNTCKHLSEEERTTRSLMRDPALRLDVANAPIVHFEDAFQGSRSYDLPSCSGDFIVRRSDGIFAYQLAVVVDDAAAGINSVVRGVDLLASTPKQLFLQEVLGYGCPQYGHVPIFIDECGRKLSKRNGDASLEHLIDDLHLGPDEILGHLAYLSGMIPEFQPMSISELKRTGNLSSLKGRQQIVWHAPDSRLCGRY